MIKILDSTLREGEQTPYVNFTVDEKIEIAKLLDKIGVDMIEAGDPSVSPKVYEAIKKISSLNLKAEIIAHSLAMKSGIEKAKSAGVNRVVVFFPTSKIHLETKMRKTQEEALEIIKEHVKYAKSLGLKVRYTPEDATRTEFDFLVKACNTAIEAGADRISIADTLGIMQPHVFYDQIKKLKKALLPCEIDVHCHNDFGLALANAMAAVRAGANCIHVTVNGMGERTGIPDLAETIIAYNVLDNVEKYDLKYIKELSSYVEKASGFFTAPNKTIIGQNAFSHKSGVHTNGVIKNPKTYEAFDPEIVGMERKIIIDKYTGKAAVKSKLDEYNIKVDEEGLKKIVMEIKKIGDDRKILHDADIIEIAERITGETLDVIPKTINAIILIAVESQVYTTSVVRRLKNFKNIDSVFEITGDHDISAYVKVDSTAELNNLIEELRTVPGIKQTNTKLVLKKHNGVHNGKDKVAE
ncbi:homocitrate synthase [Candidatus Woesearchaeota archaeon]|nr:homocitrate synthase [Candidatus Woesearchaeota archaeon]